MTHPQYTAKHIARFWSRVDRSAGLLACWLWLAGTTPGGYGRFKHAGRDKRAHVIAWELAFGPVPDGLCVCHNCPSGDNPACVNPAHLWLGTHAENANDRHAKGRTARGARSGRHTKPEATARGDRQGLRLHPERAAHGEQHGRAKLTEDNVRIIRSQHASGAASYLTLAQQFGVSQQSIAGVVHRKTWKHID